MINMKLQGNHYEAGFACGKQMIKQGIYLHQLPVMHNSHERIGYAKDCMKLYQQYFPEILEELQGFVDAQAISYEEASAFLFGMYSYTMDVHCTCFAVKKDETILLGRNSDFSISIADLCMHMEYTLQDGISFIGNTTSWIQAEDGVNEAGLAVGLSFVYPIVKRAGFNAGILVRYLLEKCRNVKEAIYALQRLPIGSAQNITLADAEGNIAVVECNCMDMEVTYPTEKENFVVATNHFQSEGMRKYQCMFLPDDIHSMERYACAASALAATKHADIAFVKNLLAGSYGFMCQYDRILGMDTVWSSIYDLTKKQSYLCDGNPSQETFLLLA